MSDLRPRLSDQERGDTRLRIREVSLARAETDAIRQWADCADGDPYAQDFDAYDRDIGSRLTGLPETLLASVAGFVDAPDGAGVLRLRGLPLPESLPPTPSVPYARDFAPLGTEPVMLAIAMLVGQAVSRPQMRNGARVHNIYPLPGDEATQKASNAVRLEAHTEMAFQDNPPDALAILCLRTTDSPPATGFADLAAVWRALDANQRSLLCDPAFAFRYTGSDGTDAFTSPQPIAVAKPNGMRFQYDHGVHGTTAAHETALRSLRAGLQATAVELTLTPGDLTLIDNRHVVHGRSPMDPGYDGADRWLQRCLLRMGREWRHTWQ
jgi:L-asparagine oxygenase